MLYACTVSKGYYTSEWAGDPLPASRRIALEVEFTRELEAHLGGAESTNDLCLAASSGDAAALQRLKAAAAAAEKAVRSSTEVPVGRFHLRAWSAKEL